MDVITSKLSTTDPVFVANRNNMQEQVAADEPRGTQEYLRRDCAHISAVPPRIYYRRVHGPTRMT